MTDTDLTPWGAWLQSLLGLSPEATLCLAVAGLVLVLLCLTWPGRRSRKARS